MLFLTVHMTSKGTEATIVRANRNVRREMAELTVDEKKEALCYTQEYVMAYVHSRGKLDSIPVELRASPERKRIRELNWWAPGEAGEFDCPAGT